MKEKQRISAGCSRGIVSLVINIALFAVLSSSASAFQITINPGAYPGQYRVTGGQTVTGTTTLQLGMGSYQLVIPTFGGFFFTVDAQGQVSSQNPAAAQGVGNTLVFHTTTIAIDPTTYTGIYSVDAASPQAAAGPRNVILVPGVDYFLRIPTFGGFFFTVDAQGQVSSQNPAAAQGVGNTLVFHTTTIAIDPTTYTGIYSVDAASPQAAAGPRNVILVPGVNYFLRIPTFGGFFFTVDAQGQVSSQNPAAAQGVGNTLVFHTTTIAIDPTTYTGIYSVDAASPQAAAGPRNVILVPGVNYFLRIPTFGGFFFTVDAQGQVSSQNPAAAQGVGNTLVFHTTTIAIDPTTYTGTYSVDAASPQAAAGPRNVILVPGVDYFLRIASGNSYPFNVDVSGKPTPSSLPVTVAGQSYTFLLSVPRPDAPPTAVIIGPPNAQEGELVTLDGSGSRDPEGDPLTYCWTQLAGPDVPIPDCPAEPQLPFIAPEVPSDGATLTFQLVVSDGHQESDPATANIIVTNVNHAPVADAGPDQRVKELSPVTLDGSQSYDSDRDPLTYQWVQTGGPSVTLSDPTTVQPSFTAPEVGPAGAMLTFELTVSDDQGANAMDPVTIVVENQNHPPLADAGAAQTVDEGKLVQLHGTASSDPDNEPLTFSWTQLHGTAVVLAGANTPTLSFTTPLVPSHSQETLVFRLEVSDGLDTSIADVAMTVLDVDAPPACGFAQAAPAVLWPPNHGLVAVALGGVSDPDNDQTTLTVTGVTQDEPVQGLGDGDTSPDAVLQRDKVLLRAERSGTGNGRVYRVSFMADDGHGGSCTGAVTVCVPHDRRPGTCVDDGQQYNATQP